MKISLHIISTVAYCFISITLANATINETDSLVRFSDLTFNGSLEEKLFKQTLDKRDGESILGLFIAINGAMDNQSLTDFFRHYQNGLNEIKSKKLEKRTPEKKIKVIYATAHDRFLRKYEYKNTFSDIFTSGVYNCVSATALYALIFDDLGIPYTIREEPSHVYLIGYPKASGIVVETTDPTGGYFILNDRFKENFVNNLKRNKLISDAEFRSTGVNEIFNQYYFNEEEISLLELIGIQYSNDALYKMDDSAWKEAFVQLEKGYMFYPSEKIKFLLFSAAANILENLKYETNEDLDFLIKFSRYKEVGITPENIVAEFSKVTKRQLIDNYQPDLYMSSYNYLMNGIDDSTTREEISLYYNYEVGRVLLNRGDYKKSLVAIESAYRIKPGNVDIQAMLINGIISNLKTYNTNNEVVTNLESYIKSYPDLVDNNTFSSVLASAYLIQFAQAFEQSNSNEGEKYKLLFERIYREKPHLTVESYHIGRAYSVAAIFYFRKGNTTKARKTLSEGLVFSPNNFEITKRLEMIK